MWESSSLSTHRHTHARTCTLSNSRCCYVLHQTHFILSEPISRKSVAGKARVWICLPGIRWICIGGSSFFWRVSNISQSVLCANCENIYFNTIVLYVWLFKRWNVLELNIKIKSCSSKTAVLVSCLHLWALQKYNYMSEKFLLTFWWHHTSNVLCCYFYCSPNRFKQYCFHQREEHLRRENAVY